MKKILVTGASGFAGKHLIDLLSSSKEFDLVGTYLNISDSLPQDLARFIKVDLSNEEDVRKLIKEVRPDVIFHLAALTSPKDSFTNPSETFQNNVFSQINLLEAIRLEGLQNSRIIIVSSGEIYGLVSKNDLPIDEETPLNPTNPYAVSKIACDFLALQYFNSYKLDIVRIRPFNHTGPGQSPNFVVSAFAKKIAEIEKGKLTRLTVGNLEGKRDFTDVRDMVRAYVLAQELGKAGEVYNVGSGRSYEIREILDKLLSYSKVKIRVEQDPSLLLPLDNPELVCDFSKFSKDTSWKPEILIDQTLRETLDYWRGIT